MERRLAEAEVQGETASEYRQQVRVCGAACQSGRLKAG
jgi:hypothetical protein